MNRLLLTLCALAWFLVGVWAVGVYYVSSLSGKEVADVMPLELWDKGLHFVCFFLGSLLLAAALRLVTTWRWRTIIPATALAISLFGGTDEWHQMYTKDRHGGDAGDWAADTLGGMTGAATCALVAREMARRRGRGFRRSL